MSVISLTANQAIKRLKVQCSSNNVDTAVEDLGEHEANCDSNAIIPCPNLCSVPLAPGSSEVRYTTRTMQRKDLLSHMLVCPRRKAECAHCGTTGAYQWIVTRHIEECTKLEVSCPNEGCGEKVVHLYLLDHRAECLYERVACSYETLGCTHAMPRVQREELQQHEKNLNLHIGLMIASFQKQQLQYAYFKIEDFSYYQSVGKAFKYSVDMWNWYIIIDTNGRGEGGGTHISVSLHWKHAFRNMPSWLNSVKIELLNYREDKNHITYIFSDPDGLVNEQFVAHSSLGYNPTFNLQYLKDETLCFRVTSTIIACKQLKPNTTW